MNRPKPKLLDQVRDRIRLKHYSIRTEQGYIGWIRRFIIFHGKRHPSTIGATEVTQPEILTQQDHHPGRERHQGQQRRHNAR